MRARIVLALLVLVALPPAGASAATPQTSVSEISSEVMCPICGTLLELAEAPQAQRQKAFIARLVAEGKSKEEIKEALVAEYGEGVLALPRGSGFDLSAYLVPIVGFAIALLGLAIAIFRWRKAGRGGGERPRTGGPNAEEAQRLEADLARYDL